MGCERGPARQSAWSRANQDRLPEHFFNKDAFADGIGGWDNQWARERTDACVQAEIEAISRARDEAGACARRTGAHAGRHRRPRRQLGRLMDEMGATIAAIVQGSAQQVARPRYQGHRDARRELYWHGVSQGV